MRTYNLHQKWWRLFLSLKHAADMFLLRNGKGCCPNREKANVNTKPRSNGRCLFRASMPSAWAFFENLGHSFDVKDVLHREKGFCQSDLIDI
jgi:hypothetical protein